MITKIGFFLTEAVMFILLLATGIRIIGEKPDDETKIKEYDNRERLVFIWALLLFVTLTQAIDRIFTEAFGM